MFTVENVLERHFPQLPYKKALTPVLRQLLKEKEFHQFKEQHRHAKGLDFVEEVLNYFDFSYQVADREKERIPANGRVVIIANHPIGSLDGLALLKLVSEVRRDVKVVANALLSEVEPLQSLLCPVNNMVGSTQKSQLLAIQECLNQNQAVIIFPSGEVSRLRPQGVRDTRWQSGFLRLARQSKAPILPIRLEARNSALFYSTSMLYKPLATSLLVQEMFKQRHKKLQVHIGELIPHSQLDSIQALPKRTQIKLFKKHLYRVGTQKRLPFKTETAIAPREDRQVLLQVLSHCQLLGQTPDGMQIHLYHYQPDCPLMREIGRLREIAFRAVGEGTGKRRDIDPFDVNYLHLVLWDPKRLEIAGAYRLADAKRLGREGLYSQTLFNYGPDMDPILEQGLELGRSFVQPAYWGKRALDYLWLGIGAFLAKNPHYRYLFGPVSLSANFPPAARDLMVYFYRHYFGKDNLSTRHHTPYQLDSQTLEALTATFKGDDYKHDFVQLKDKLASMGASVPTLYKQYADVCEPGGVKFLDFGVDPDFGDCVDGLVLVDVSQLKDNKRARYIDSHQ
ncbi:GNAT family N-acyltransferase [Gallaecimonas pentaromativorans]|uniref:L-ornithine N(alpha)-acyltransferase n=1 Tax=Gallaecimonas pentaromativorans TaxID=584787 RepID=A0A3N1P1Q8_9GAMM|nr:lysophospholipid acyltransferase family protein [Gallaecimonas pentaromativorans]ROQ22385.1 putative hemolysin [Gallaecimonas pentaromativorans]